MFLAEEAATAIQRFNGFDIFMIAFTILIFIGFVRLVTARPRKNWFAILFTAASLGLFLVVDYIMIFKVWLS